MVTVTGWGVVLIYISNIKPVFPGITQQSGQISIIPKPELRGFWGSSLIKPPFRVTTRETSL